MRNAAQGLNLTFPEHNVNPGWQAWQGADVVRVSRWWGCA